MIWKISALAKFEIWGVFANTLTLDDNYPVPILQTLKDLVRPLSKKSRVRTCFDSQYVKGSQTLKMWNLQETNFIVFSHHSEGK